MADTAIWSFTSGATADATDRIATARSSSANVYITPATIVTYITGLANTWAAGQVFTTNLRAPLVIGGAGTTSTLTFKTTTGVGTTNADMIFQVGNDGATEAMRILNSAAVGIGTASPVSIVDIIGAHPQFYMGSNKTAATDKYAISAAHQYDIASEAEGFTVIGSAGQNGVNTVYIGGFFSETNAATAISFWTAANAATRSGTERISISSGGTVVFNDSGADADVRMEGDTDANLFFLDASTDRIGIGTASPAYRVDITQNQAATTALAVQNSNTGGNSQGLWISGSASYLRMLASHANGGGSVEEVNGNLLIGTVAASTVVRFQTVNSERMRLDAVGNLKIAGTATRGTTEGTNHLDIFDGTAPVGTLTNGVSVYSASGLLLAMNAAGVANTLCGTSGAMTAAGLITGAGLTTSDSTTYTVAAKGPILKQGANGRVGTFTCNGVTPVTVNNTSIAVSDAITISLNTVGGVVGAVPAIQTITAATGFTVAGTAADTSVYNYTIIKNAA